MTTFSPSLKHYLLTLTVSLAGIFLFILPDPDPSNSFYKSAKDVSGIIISGLGTLAFLLGLALNFLKIESHILSIEGKTDALEICSLTIEQQTEKILTHTTDELSGTLMELKQWVNDERHPFHVRVTSDVLVAIIEQHLLDHVRRFKQFALNPQQKVTFDDYSPVYEMLYQMFKSLPQGGVWCGITLLENENAWKKPVVKAFDDLKHLYHSRSSTDEVAIFRLYHFSTKRAFESLSSELEREARSGIRVRYSIGGREPPDISLLWAPPGDDPNVSLPPNSADVITELLTRKYNQLCALQFDTREGALLTAVHLHPPSSNKFESYMNQFREFWREAKEL
jgi:hypothetical protein